MFNMGFLEMVVLGVVALLVIGPRQLPEVAKVVGRMINEFRRATGDLTSSIQGFKSEAEKYVHDSSQYMHKQKEEFEKSITSQDEVSHSENEGQGDDDETPGDTLK